MRSLQLCNRKGIPQPANVARDEIGASRRGQRIRHDGSCVSQMDPCQPWLSWRTGSAGALGAPTRGLRRGQDGQIRGALVATVAAIKVELDSEHGQDGQVVEELVAAVGAIQRATHKVERKIERHRKQGEDGHIRPMLGAAVAAMDRG